MILKIQQENGEAYLPQSSSAAVTAGKTRRNIENKEGLLGLRRESKTDLKIKRTREEGRSRRRAAALPETARRKAEERKRGE